MKQSGSVGGVTRSSPTSSDDLVTFINIRFMFLDIEVVCVVQEKIDPVSLEPWGFIVPVP